MNAPEKALIPSLRFPEFSEAWEEKRLGDIATYKAGKFVAASAIAERRQDGHYPCYGANGLRGYTTSTTHSGSYPIIGRQGALCGNVRIVSGDFHATEHAVVVSSKKSTSVSWLFYELGKLKINRFATGQAQPGVSVETIESLKTHIPTLPEQQKIADYLGAVDAKLRLLERRRDALTAYKKGMMQRIFAQEIRFTQEDGTAFPDWQEKQLGDVAEIYQPETLSQSQLDVSGKYPVFGANGQIGWLGRYNHETEQVSITCRGSTCGTVSFIPAKSWITGNSMVINLDSSKMLIKKFAYNLLQFTNWKYLITGSGQPQITGEIKKHIFFCPHPDEQQKIADFLSAIDDKITAATRRITAMQDFKKSMLQQMFV